MEISNPQKQIIFAPNGINIPNQLLEWGLEFLNPSFLPCEWANVQKQRVNKNIEKYFCYYQWKETAGFFKKFEKRYNEHPKFSTWQ